MATSFLFTSVGSGSTGVVCDSACSVVAGHFVEALHLFLRCLKCCVSFMVSCKACLIRGFLAFPELVEHQDLLSMLLHLIFQVLGLGFFLLFHVFLVGVVRGGCGSKSAGSR